jgi:hypothetical protein
LEKEVSAAGKASVVDKIRAAWRSLSPAWKFSLVAVTAMRVFYTLWSLFFLSAFSLVVQNQDYFGKPVVSVFDLQTSQSYAYDRSVDGLTLSFQKFDNAHLIDTKTGSLWDAATGKCTSGFYVGRELSPSDISPESLFPYYGVTPHRVPAIAIWQRFDANWYLLIAQKGYGTVSGDVHFPPLYPILIRWVSIFLRDEMLASLFLSQLALYYLVKLLYDLFAEWGSPATASKALFFFLIFPTSFFLFSAYTEALFMIAAILCLRSIQTGKWHWAGFWIFCATLIRLQGIVLLLPLAWGIFQTRFKNVRWVDLFFAGFSPAVAAGVYLLLRAGVGDSSVIPLNEANLHARMVFPWETVLYSVRYIFDGSGGYIDVLNLVTFLSFSVLLVMYWKKFPIEYALFSAASILIFSARWVDTQPLNSMIRYLLTVFPIFFLLGRFGENKWVNRLIFLGFLGLNLFLCGQFFLWGWVA